MSILAQFESMQHQLLARADKQTPPVTTPQDVIIIMLWTERAAIANDL
jgi:hypothetical protein